MRRRIVGLSIFVVVALGVAVGVYFAGQVSDGTTVGQEGETAVVPTVTPPVTPESSVTPLPSSPTPPHPLVETPTPESTPMPTSQPGVCPPPVRPTAEELGPPPTPMWEQPVQGGVPYSAGYVTVRLPAGREFNIVGYWSHDESGTLIEIGDVQSGSGLIIRGDDGCERARFVRQPAADAVFDEIMTSLEIGPTYACPLPVRTTYEDLPVPVGPPPADGSGLPGERVQGGVAFKFGQTALQLPAGREFLVGGGLSDPGGPFLAVYDIQTRSSLFLRPDGCETSRMIWDPAADAVFDGIVRTLEVP